MKLGSFLLCIFCVALSQSFKASGVKQPRVNIYTNSHHTCNDAEYKGIIRISQVSRTFKNFRKYLKLFKYVKAIFPATPRAGGAPPAPEIGVRGMLENEALGGFRN